MTTDQKQQVVIEPNSHKLSNALGSEMKQSEDNASHIDDVDTYEAKDQVDNNKAGQSIIWKLQTQTVQQWLANKDKFSFIYGDEYIIPKGGVYRLIICPNGVQQEGWENDFAIFIKMESLPFGVVALDSNLTLACDINNINFKSNVRFSNGNEGIRCIGWSKNTLLSECVSAWSAINPFVTFTCSMEINRVALIDSQNVSFTEFMQRKNFEESPNIKFRRYKMNKKSFVSSTTGECIKLETFDVNNFEFMVELFPRGYTTEGFVQPFLHCTKMADNIDQIVVHYAFYFPHVSAGYSKTEVFNGKVGKGWTDLTLKTDKIADIDCDNIYMECRVNILHVTMNADKWCDSVKNIPKMN
eukprot:173671_1